VYQRTCFSAIGEIVTEQERKMKRLVSMLFVVAALCVALSMPAAAAKPIEVKGEVIAFAPPADKYRPIGKGEDDHYCLITLDNTRELRGDVAGTVSEHYEILKLGPCETGPATYPSKQRAWGTFIGSIWDGKDGHVEGTCKTTFHGGWYWNEESITGLAFEGRLTLHACTGGLAGAHANLELGPVGDELVYSGRAFFGGKP
jgi:hypothetical protein